MAQSNGHRSGATSIATQWMEIEMDGELNGDAVRAEGSPTEQRLLQSDIVHLCMSTSHYTHVWQRAMSHWSELIGNSVWPRTNLGQSLAVLTNVPRPSLSVAPPPRKLHICGKHPVSTAPRSRTCPLSCTESPGCIHKNKVRNVVNLSYCNKQQTLPTTISSSNPTTKLAFQVANLCQ